MKHPAATMNLLGQRPAGPVFEVVEAIEQDIILGRLTPRERLVEETLSQRLGTKRHLVRRALAEMERLGLVVREPNKGVMVRDFSLEEIEEIFEMREILIERAAKKIPLPGDGKLVGKLERLVKEHSDAINDRYAPAVYRLNRDFHDTLFGACGNKTLADTISYFAWILNVFRSYRMVDPTLMRRATADHTAIVEALRVGDREELVRRCLDHIRPPKEVYLRMHGWWPEEDQMPGTAA